MGQLVAARLVAARLVAANLMAASLVAARGLKAVTVAKIQPSQELAAKYLPGD